MHANGLRENPFIRHETFGWSDSVCVACQNAGNRVWISHSSYLEYLKTIDVEHTHDLVPGFDLCLEGDSVDVDVMHCPFENRITDFIK